MGIGVTIAAIAIGAGIAIGGGGALWQWGEGQKKRAEATAEVVTDMGPLLVVGFLLIIAIYAILRLRSGKTFIKTPGGTTVG